MTNLFLKMPEEKKQEHINGFAAIQVEEGVAKETFSLNDKKTLNYYIQLAKNYFSTIKTGTIIIPRKKSVNVTPKTAHLDLSKK